MTQQRVSGTAKHARRLLRPLQPQITRLLRELVRTDTVATPPNGNETAGQFVLRDFLREYGIKSELYEIAFVARSRHPWRHTDRNYAGRKNLGARISGSGRGKSLLLNGHMDTVPPGKARWAASPWSGKISNGRMYGLGAFDMKGGVAAQAAVLSALKAGGIRPGGDVILESVADEEWGGGGGTAAGRLRSVSADACVIAEGTQLEIFRATRGGFVVDLIVQAGDPEQYFSSKEVPSPAVPLGRLLGWVDSWTKKRRKRIKSGAYAAFPDPTPVQVLAIESNRIDPDVPLSVPLCATVRVYFQFLPQEDVPAIKNEVRRSLKEFEQRDPFFRKHTIRWQMVVDPPLRGHELPASHPWLKCMAASAKSLLGKEPIVTAAPYPCDAFLVQREGIPTLLFGPRGAGAHNPDEYVEIDSVIQTAEVLLTAALAWCGNG